MFEVKTDACQSGIGTVLKQQGRPVGYFSKVLAQKHWNKSIYEKEFMALLSFIDK